MSGFWINVSFYYFLCFIEIWIWIWGDFSVVEIVKVEFCRVVNVRVKDVECVVVRVRVFF